MRHSPESSSLRCLAGVFGRPAGASSELPLPESDVCYSRAIGYTRPPSTARSFLAVPAKRPSRAPTMNDHCAPMRRTARISLPATLHPYPPLSVTNMPACFATTPRTAHSHLDTDRRLPSRRGALFNRSVSDNGARYRLPTFRSDPSVTIVPDGGGLPLHCKLHNPNTW